MKQVSLGHGKFALVDDVDYEHVARHKWYYIKERLNRTAYATANIGKEVVGMHRFVLRLYPGEMFHVDHKDRNGLNNQRSNLRITDRSGNGANRKKLIREVPTSSQFKGVSWHNSNEMWAAYITCRGKRTGLGYFHTEIDAAAAYDEAAVKLFGEFAVLNNSGGDAKAIATRTPSSRYRGVEWYKAYSKWSACIRCQGTRYHLGYFTDEIEAAKAYNAKATELLGDKAKLNPV